MKAIELGSAMVTKSPDFTPLAAMPRAMRLLRRCSSRQVMVLSSQVTAGASGLAAATRTSAAPIDMGFSGVPGSAMDSCLDETKSPSLREGRRESNRCAGGRLAYTGIGLNGAGALEQPYRIRDCARPRRSGGTGGGQSCREPHYAASLSAHLLLAVRGSGCGDACCCAGT